MRYSQSISLYPLATVLLLLLVFVNGQAQNKTLEIYVRLIPETREFQLYLRIFDNGQFEYEDIIIEDEKGSGFAKPKHTIRTGKISVSELKDLVDLLNSSEVRSVGTFYTSALPTSYPIVQLKISIPRAERIQAIELLNFLPKFKTREGKNLFPGVLDQLLCRVARLRGTAKIKAAFEEFCPR